jgi:hypothetical protein
MSDTVTITLDREEAKAFVEPVGKSTPEISAAFLGASQEIAALIRAALDTPEHSHVPSGLKAVLGAKLINRGNLDERFTLNEVEDAFDTALTEQAPSVLGDEDRGLDRKPRPVQLTAGQLRELKERRNDPEFRARLKRSIEENRELLDRLAPDRKLADQPEGKCCANCVEVKPDVVTLPDWPEGTGPCDLCLPCIGRMLDARRKEPDAALAEHPSSSEAGLRDWLRSDEAAEIATRRFTSIHWHNAPLKYGGHARETMREALAALTDGAPSGDQEGGGQ